LPFYYGWVNVVLAALAMVGTLPGRTHGLGLVTEPLLEDLHLDRIDFAQINLWATLIGAVFCLPAGWFIDRWGTRLTTVLVVLALGLTVGAMSVTTSVVALFLLITLTRGFGQSALSVVSIAMVGKWFKRRVGLAMGVYSVLIGILFAVAFRLVGYAVKEQGWRTAWWEIAIALIAGLVPITWLLVRSTPESCGIAPDEDELPSGERTPATGLRLNEALQTPAFWIFALGTSLYGLVSSGLGLFNVAILKERGFDYDTYLEIQIISMCVGLVSQLASGWIAWRWSMRRLMALAMFLYAGSLVALPHVETLGELRMYGVAMGVAGGAIMVVFFAIWGHAFGRAHLGWIQGAAQKATVVSSAVGPLLFAECFARTGSYNATFYALAPIVFLLGVAAWIVPLPARVPEALSAVAVAPAA
jgi:MFS family permease